MKLSNYLLGRQIKKQVSIYDVKLNDKSIKLYVKFDFIMGNSTDDTNKISVLLRNRASQKDFNFHFENQTPHDSYETGEITIPLEFFDGVFDETWDLYLTSSKKGEVIRIRDLITNTLESSIFPINQDRALKLYTTVKGNFSIKSTFNHTIAEVVELDQVHNKGFAITGKILGVKANKHMKCFLVFESEVNGLDYKFEIQTKKHLHYVNFYGDIQFEKLNYDIFQNEFKLAIEINGFNHKIRRIPLSVGKEDKLKKDFYIANNSKVHKMLIKKAANKLSVIFTNQNIQAEASEILIDREKILLSGYLLNRDSINLNGQFEIVVKKRESLEIVKDRIEITDNKFEITLDICFLMKENLINNGVWDLFLNINNELIRIVTRLNGVDNKRSVVNMPQIILPNHLRENKVIKVYYTLHEELSLLVRNHIVNKRLDQIQFKRNKLYIDGLVNVQITNDDPKENLDGKMKIKLPYGKKIELPFNLRISKTGRNMLEHRYRATADIQGDIKGLLYDNINFDLIECTVELFGNNSLFYINALPIKLEKTLGVFLSKHKYLQKLNNSMKLKLYHIMNKVLPVKSNCVIFQSTTGMNYSCNPRGIYEELLKENHKVKTVWVLNNNLAKIDGNTKVVKPNTLKYYYYLSIGKFFVNNGNFPDFYVKRDSTVHIQTWHGTPLKKLGFDISPNSPSYRENTSESLLKRNARWDYLVAPNEYTGNILRRAYLFNKNMLNVGYPRNDILYKSDSNVLEIKKYLNIPNHKKVILYAPTWRDNEFHSGLANEPYEFKFRLDQFVKRFGDEYVLLLRLHPRDSVRCQIKEYENCVFNVSNYDDIKYLYLISDVLITDYSSVMFDFANTKKPIIFFAYDIKQYSSALRGFYFNLYEEAPGPIVTNEKDLFSVLQVEQKIMYLYESKYKTFYEKFCSWEDGHSAKRIVNKVFQNL